MRVFRLPLGSWTPPLRTVRATSQCDPCSSRDVRKWHYNLKLWTTTTRTQTPTPTLTRKTPCASRFRFNPKRPSAGGKVAGLVMGRGSMTLPTTMRWKAGICRPSNKHAPSEWRGLSLLDMARAAATVPNHRRAKLSLDKPLFVWYIIV